MLFFVNDYCEGAHPKILEKLVETNMENFQVMEPMSIQKVQKRKLPLPAVVLMPRLFFLRVEPRQTRL